MHEIFLTLFLTGALGLVVMTLMGRMHIGHSAHHISHTSHAPHIPHSSHATQHSTNHSSTNQRGNTLGGKESAGIHLVGLISPVLIFSILLASGGAGLILLKYLQSPWIVSSIAALIGILFYAFGISPLLRLIMNFESKPALTLAGTVASEAEVVSSFNEHGQGVVMLNIDGQTSRVLAHLDPSSTASVGEIRVGDKLVVTQINEKTNSCNVAKL
jgi:hypothetical protein